MINKISKDDSTSMITQLIKKATLVLINSRSNNQLDNNKIDDSFLLSEPKNNDYLDDFFTDDYGNKNKSISNSHLFFLEFYYHRPGFKCLLEKWTFYSNYTTSDFTLELNIKESILFIRSMYIMARMLPCFAINSKQKGKIDYRLYLNNKNTDYFPSKALKISHIKIENTLVKVEMDYLSIDDFNKIDNENLNATNTNKNETQAKQRQRHFSLDEKKMKPIYEVMAWYQKENENFIDEDYFSNDSECSIKNLKSNNSSSNKPNIGRNTKRNKRKTTFFSPLSNRDNLKNHLNQCSLLSSSSESESASHSSSSNSFQLDIIACNEESQEETLNKVNLVLKEKKPSMTNLQLQLEPKEDWVEVVAEGIHEDISAIVSNFSLLKTSLQKRNKVAKVNVVPLAQLYKCFLQK